MYKELKIEQTVQNNHVNVLPKRFLWNGHTIGFGPQTEQLEPPCENPLFTLNVGERVKFFFKSPLELWLDPKVYVLTPHIWVQVLEELV